MRGYHNNHVAQMLSLYLVSIIENLGAEGHGGSRRERDRVNYVLEKSWCQKELRETSDKACIGSRRPTAMQNTQETCTRDDTFYFDDGSCVIRVGDTLFNVSPRFVIVEEHFNDPRSSTGPS